MTGRAVAACAMLTLLGTAACLADGAAGMADAANGFYGVYATFHPSDGIPDAAGRARYQPFLSPALDALLARGAQAEQGFAWADKGAPPLLEGDIFTSNFEGATAFKVGACSGDAKTGRCTVALAYDDRGAHPGDKPLAWNDTVYLVATTAGWRVDDIGYGATWAFGNKGRLTDTLKSAIADSGH